MLSPFRKILDDFRNNSDVSSGFCFTFRILQKFDFLLISAHFMRRRMGNKSRKIFFAKFVSPTNLFSPEKSLGTKMEGWTFETLDICIVIIKFIIVKTRLK